MDVVDTSMLESERKFINTISVEISVNLGMRARLEQEFLTAKQMAELLGYTDDRQVRKQAADGKFPGAFRTNGGTGQWRIPRSALEKAGADARKELRGGKSSIDDVLVAVGILRTNQVFINNISLDKSEILTHIGHSWLLQPFTKDALDYAIAHAFDVHEIVYPEWKEVWDATDSLLSELALLGLITYSMRFERTKRGLTLAERVSAELLLYHLTDLGREVVYYLIGPPEEACDKFIRIARSDEPLVAILTRMEKEKRPSFTWAFC